MENLVKTQTIKSLTEKEHLYRDMFTLHAHEILWYRKLEVQAMIHRLHKELQAITYNNDQRTHGSWTKEFNKIQKGLRLTAQWDTRRSLKLAWFEFIKDLVPNDYNDRLSRIYYHCLLALQDSLSDEWLIALRDKKWKSYLQILLGLQKSGIRHRTKNQIADLVARTTTTMQTITSIAIATYEPVRTIHAQSHFWSLELIWELLKLVYGIWPTVLRHYWRPETYLDFKWIVDPQGFGIIGLLIGWGGMFAHASSDMYHNENTFQQSMLPWNAIQATSRIKKIPQPKKFNWLKLKQIKFNENQDPNHHTCKWNTLAQIVHHVLYDKHLDILQQLYGQAKFTNNGGFNTTILNNPTFESSIGKLMSTLQTTSISIKDDKFAQIKDTLDNLHSYKINMFINPVIPKLTTYSREFVDDRMYILYIHLYMIFAKYLAKITYQNIYVCFKIPNYKYWQTQIKNLLTQI